MIADISKVQTSLDSQTIVYANKIQDFNRVQSIKQATNDQPDLEDASLKHLKSKFDTTLKRLQARKQLKMTILKTVMAYQVDYDDAKINFDQAKREYDYLVKKLPIKSPITSDSLADIQIDPAQENIDFLLNFLDQQPLTATEVDAATRFTYDASIPFAHRPAITMPRHQPLSNGHVTWQFNTDKNGEKMTRDELEKRIRTDLNLPHFKAQIDDQKDYSEDEFQEFKSSLVNYYKAYVQDIDTDFQGGLK